MLSFNVSSSVVVRRAALAVALLSVGAIAWACADNDSTAPAATRTVYGASQVIGSGTARTYVTLNSANKPTALGVALSDSAMFNLPSVPMAPSPSAVMLNLALPTEAPVAGYDHIMVDWNPNGHEPDHVYTLPHFDFHFYNVTTAEVMAILPTDAQYATKAASLPAAPYVPVGYAAASTLGGTSAAAAAVPMMGLHWLDTSAPELQPAPNGTTFTETFIYGTWDGKFTFIEPMITKAYLESLKNSAGMSRAVPVAAQVAKAGYYPSAYSIRYDATAKEYRISLESLTFRQ